MIPQTAQQQMAEFLWLKVLAPKRWKTKGGIIRGTIKENKEVAYRV